MEKTILAGCVEKTILAVRVECVCGEDDTVCVCVCVCVCGVCAGEAEPAPLFRPITRQSLAACGLIKGGASSSNNDLQTS